MLRRGALRDSDPSGYFESSGWRFYALFDRSLPSWSLHTEQKLFLQLIVYWLYYSYVTHWLGGRNSLMSMISAREDVGGWGGVLGLGFAGYVQLASQNRYPIIVYSVVNYRPHLSHFWASVIFAIPTLLLSIFLWIVPFFRLNGEHLLFTYSTNILVC